MVLVHDESRRNDQCIKLKLDTLITTLTGQGDRAALSSISSEIYDGGLLEARKKLSKVLVQTRQATGLLMQR